ncbi:MAG TPA: DUF1175 family protein [Bryobacteraceae bacterium]|nr:DUF1175 family protein [Bryobacteraceae bacterium]
MRRRHLILALAGAACGHRSEHTRSRQSAAGELFLDDPGDRRAFTSWFTFIAEAMYARDTHALPKAVSDCAGLLRFCFAESLRRHDIPWARSLALPFLPAAGRVQRFEYPRTTPHGPRLFRTSQSDSSWAEFADAQTLMRHNAHLRTRDIQQAQPGDLLFYEQLGARSPYHCMAFLGPSRLEEDRGPFVVYHTGPSHPAGSAPEPGEVRRPSLEQLLAHPSPEWRPLEGNPNFLGVYRWNLLEEAT